jgi:SAM-dependent methyltransferase
MLFEDEHLRRVEHERAFHNARFTEEVRDAQGKYYASIKHGSARFERRVMQLGHGADVLEYGCGSAIQGLNVARAAKSLTGIDISDVAIADASAAARRKDLVNTTYVVMDAEDMTFPPASFDLVFGRGILHHLDLERCFSSIARVLRPGGRAVFWEPLGHNPVLNRYREMTPEARTPDEHPLLASDFRLAERFFEINDVRFCGLTTILSVPVRDTKLGDALLKVTSALDELLFVSPLRWLAWYALIELRKAADADR